MIHRLKLLTWTLAAMAAGILLAHSGARAQEKIDTNKIPAKVMGALKAKFPNAQIHKSTKEKEAGNDVYDLEFTQKGRKFEADVKLDGTIVNWEKEIAARNLPEAVKRSVEAKYPKSSLKEVMEVTAVKGGKDAPEGYEVLLETAAKKKIEVTVARDGKFLEGSGAKK